MKSNGNLYLFKIKNYVNLCNISEFINWQYMSLIVVEY